MPNSNLILKTTKIVCDRFFLRCLRNNIVVEFVPLEKNGNKFVRAANTLNILLKKNRVPFKRMKVYKTVATEKLSNPNHQKNVVFITFVVF